MTNNLVRRVLEHKNKEIKGFTGKYNVDKLVYSEKYEDVNEAIKREKQLKKWNRKWKLELIESVNPTWYDYSEDFILTD